MFGKINLLAAAVVLLAAIGIIAAACTEAGASESDVQALREQLSRVEASLQRSQVVAAVGVLSAVPFHDIDEETQMASEIPEDISGPIERARAAVIATAWPDELGEQTEALEAALNDFVAALDAEDLQAVKTAATDAHDAWHDIEHALYAYLSGEESQDGATEEHGG